MSLRLYATRIDAYHQCFKVRPCITSVYQSRIAVAGRVYASSQSGKFDVVSTEKHKSATSVVDAKVQVTDCINPPVATLPPPLNLPQRDQSSYVVVHYFKLGRSYGKFYWAGIKATWSNHQSVRPLRARLDHAVRAKQINLPSRYGILSPDATDLAIAALDIGQQLTRAEFQQLVRDQRDWGKAPVFGVLVLALGEWLPLFVPFFPGLVPRTCRIPSQIKSMRDAQEDRRRSSFRQGLALPAIPTESNSTESLVKTLERDNLLHLSTSLGLHKKLWDRIGLTPPLSMLTSSVTRHLKYLDTDDLLLRRDGDSTLLSDDEMLIACEERGIDVTSKPLDVLRNDLRKWMSSKDTASSTGKHTIMDLLFKR